MEQRVLRQCLWLREQGHEILLATPQSGQTAIFAREANVPQVDFWHPKQNLLASYLQLKKIMADFNPDILDTHSSRDSVTASLLRMQGTKTKVFFTRHITRVKYNPSALTRWRWHLGFDGVIATSRLAREQIEKFHLIAPEKLHEIWEWAEEEFFQAYPDAKTRLRAEFSIPENHAVFGMVSIFREEKGHQTLLAALKNLKEAQTQNFKAIIVGDCKTDNGKFRQFLEGLSDQLGLKAHVHFTGYRADVASLMAGMDFLVVPSLLEAQTRVVPQAFAVGCPVIGSKAGAIPELIQNNENGWLVPPGDVPALTKAIQFALHNPDVAKRLAKNAKAFAETDLRMDARMHATLAAYTSAI